MKDLKIGFIGLGIMGSRMAMNIHKADFALTVYNRTASRAAELLAAGAKWGETPAEVAEQSDILITMLSTPEAVRETAIGPAGFLPRMGQGSLWMDCSTVDPAFSGEMNRQASDRGIRFLDAPVAGTKGPAESGDLLFLLGGETGDVASCQDLLDAMGKKTLHLGGHGHGARMKMLINGLLAQSMLAFAEALTLGEAMGLEQAQVMDVLLATPVTPAFLNGVRPKLETGDYEPNFPLKWMQKDLHLAASTAYSHGVSMPSLNTAKETFALAKRAGFAELDFSSIYRFLADTQE